MQTSNTNFSRILVNSLPKSGTHLLTNAVELFGYRDYAENINTNTQNIPTNFDYREVKNALHDSADAFVPEAAAIRTGSLSPLFVNPAIFYNWLDSVPDQHYIVGHLSYSPALSPILEKLHYRHLFIMRDPRAVLPSLLDFILNPQGIPKRHFLAADLTPMTLQQRFEFILNGGFAPLANETVKSFAQVYRDMLSWRDEPNCLVVRYEDLVGEQGGGSLEKQLATVENIANYLQLPFAETVISGVQKIYSTEAPTFRIGQVDSWKTALPPEMMALLNTYCEPLRQEADYES